MQLRAASFILHTHKGAASMLRIVQVEADEERLHARHLLLEYLTWVNAEMVMSHPGLSHWTSGSLGG
jgi:hypothetical protein